MKFLLKLFVMTLFFSLSLSAAVSVRIVEPVSRQVIEPCIDLTVKIEVTTTEGEQIKNVLLLSNGASKARIRTQPWEYVWKKIPKGNYELAAKVVMQNDEEFLSSPVRFAAGLVEPGEHLYNGGFDCGVVTPWRPGVNGEGQANFTVREDIYFDDPNYLEVEILKYGGNAWCVQLLQVCPLDSGHTYQFSFLADAITKKNIYIGMQQAVDPWASQFGANVEIDGADLYGPYEFTATKTDPTNDLVMHLGGDDIMFFLDNVQVVDMSVTSVKAKELNFHQGVISEYELFQAYPNPFNMNTTIAFKLSHSCDVALNVYNMNGQKIKTLADGRQTDGLHTLTWDGTDSQERIVPTGVYIYKLSIDDGTHSRELSRKMLLLK